MTCELRSISLKRASVAPMHLSSNSVMYFLSRNNIIQHFIQLSLVLLLLLLYLHQYISQALSERSLC